MKKYFVPFMLSLFLISTSGYCTMPSSESLMELLKYRHSGRSYDSQRKVTTEQIKMIVEAAKLAPSSYNEQPWTFLIADRHTHPAAFEKVFKSLVPFNQGWVKEAPLLVVVAADRRSSKTPPDNHWAEYDTGAAAYGMMLEATALGLMAHQMAGFDPEVLKKEFNIPAHFKPLAVMAIGFEKENEKIEPKDRRPTEENFFFGEWSKK